MNIKTLFPFLLRSFIMVTFMAASAAAQDLVTITVSKGENIRDIAAQHLKNPDLWPDILRANGFDSPHEVLENTVLKIPVKQILTADRVLTSSNTMIQNATREGARVFEPEMIASAIEKYTRALNERKNGQWDQAIELASAAEKEARTALEQSMIFRDLPVEAVLEQGKGNVHRRKPADTYWHDLMIRAQLSEQDKIRTLSDSYAEIRFRDDSRLRLNQNAQIVIQKMREDRLKKRKVSEVSLVGGDIYALLEGSRKTNPFGVKASGVITTIRSNNFWVDRSGSETRYANYEGEIEVTAAGESVVLKENQGTLVKKNQKPEQPRDLLSAPKNLSPADFTTVYKDGIDLKWTPDAQAAFYWLEIAADESFGSLVFNEKNIRQNSHFFPLPEDGLYFWRVAAMDADGFPGRKSNASFFKVQNDTRPPFLTITSPAAAAIIREPVVMISGSTEQDAVLTFDGQPLQVSKDGGFVFEHSLRPGENILILEALDPAGNIAVLKHSLIHMPDDAIPISYASMLQRISEKHFVTNQEIFSLTGSTRPSAAISVHSEDQVSAILNTYSDENGKFHINLPLQKETETFVLIVTLPTGFSASDNFVVEQDQIPPTIFVDAIPASQTAEDSLPLKGTVKDGIGLELNGESAATDENGRFDLTMSLSPGQNEIRLTARDAAGNTGTWKKDVLLDQNPPKLLDVSISKTYAKAGEHITIRVLASDDSGMKAAALFTLAVGEIEHKGYLKKCPDKSCYQADFTLPPAAKGKIRMMSVLLEDYLGNKRKYTFK